MHIHYMMTFLTCFLLPLLTKRFKKYDFQNDANKVDRNDHLLGQKLKNVTKLCSMMNFYCCINFNIHFVLFKKYCFLDNEMSAFVCEQNSIKYKGVYCISVQ